MVLTQFQVRYVSREDRAQLRIEVNDGDAYAFWLTRSLCLELLLRAQGLRQLAPEQVMEMERIARHPARLEVLSLDPRARDLGKHTTPLGEQPLLIDTVDVLLLNKRVVCTLAQDGLFQLQFALCWEFFSHWMTMLENIDEEADWGLIDPVYSAMQAQESTGSPAFEDIALPLHDTVQLRWKLH